MLKFKTFEFYHEVFTTIGIPVELFIICARIFFSEIMSSFVVVGTVNLEITSVRTEFHRLL